MPKDNNGGKPLLKVMVGIICSVLVTLILGSYTYTAGVAADQIELLKSHERFVTKDDLKALKRDMEKTIDEVKQQAKEKEAAFRNNPFNSQLRTHKLTGKEKEHWGFWINRQYRIKFIFLKEKEVLFLDVGTHDIYD